MPAVRRRGGLPSRLGTVLAAAVLATLMVLTALSACTSSGSDPSPSGAGTDGGDGSAASGSAAAAEARSAADLGGMAGLIEAAKKEGRLNVIALSPDWVNYGEVISTFQRRYGITVVSEEPAGTSQDEINAVNDLRDTERAPDVLDLGMPVARANTDLFAPYQVITWEDIPEEQKEPTGLWVQDYGGYMAIGYDSAQVDEPTSVADLLKADYQGKVALNGDPNQSHAALVAVVMASMATGGSADDVTKGIDFFRQLRQVGNLLPVQASPVTIRDGATPVVFDWDYMTVEAAADVPTWKVFLPSNAIIGGYYAQAINKDAPHPAAARLWQEFLFSDDGQNLWLRGGARPVRLEAMSKLGTADTEALKRLPPMDATATFLTDDQVAAARERLTAEWAKAVS